MLTRVLLAVFVVLTVVCAGIAIHYNHVFTRLEVALAETKAQLAATRRCGFRSSSATCA